MSKNRNKEQDKAETRRLILDPNRVPYVGGENWLGHGKLGGRDAMIDYLLLDGATMERMLQERGSENSIRSHFNSLRIDHDLPVRKGGDGKHRFDRQHLGISEETIPPLTPQPVTATTVIQSATPPTPIEIGVAVQTVPPGVQVSAEEGKELLRLHRLRERNPRLIRHKKQEAIRTTGKLVCEACDFDFAETYGELGQGFAECHHRVPLSSHAGPRITDLSELAIVCANCHRMLHRRPWRTVEKLRELVESRRASQ